MSPRKAVVHELSRERILAEAQELFATQGYRNLTMRSIAKGMGYSHGALYYHFKDKGELFYTLVKENFNLLLEMQRAWVVQAPPGDLANLEQMMLEFIRFGLEHPHHYEIMFVITDPELRKYSRTEQAECLDLFAEAVHSVLAGRPDEKQKAFSLPWSLFMSMHGFITYCISFGQTFEDAEKLAQDHVRYLCRGIL
ncbi:TetR/AcrR family transcriptional regulator [Paenibacillus aurantius]|uniref:TetR/AcrR family transcriptional regulator n=1 Tax=Paenibacillus aurantius TaxID=2918900 RepID=A0AA96LEY3_9BACL|nr:TetR/AcrR family transcriptional regulator [Paenibacillus aurantius]WNQ10382.1 TetR/AcrR family transcriptional regulator [Paenibacillus aurantius]